jgi:hypothetical protein
VLLGGAVLVAVGIGLTEYSFSARDISMQMSGIFVVAIGIATVALVGIRTLKRAWGS